MLEIELKAWLASTAPESLERKISDAGFGLPQTCYERDTYYNAPDRAFKKTDEALRIRERRQFGKAHTLVTYKGPKRDALSNTRTEFETSVEDADTMRSILNALGYTPVLEVRKQRRSFAGAGAFKNITLCLDEVEGLGSFIELECCAADDIGQVERESTRNHLLALLDALGIPRENLTRQSYLEQLMQRATS